MSITYTSQEVARILKVSETQFRGCLRAALFPSLTKRRPQRFTFHDLLLLQTAKRLCDAKIPIARVRRILESLKRQLPDDGALSKLKIYADGRRVVVWDGEARWQPDSGQFLINFEPALPDPPSVRVLKPPVKRTVHVSSRSADQWVLAAMELEADSPEEARRAYQEALRLDPGLVDAHINLGLLFHRERRLPEAEQCYRQAIESAPQEVLGHFNLAVVLTDAGDRRGAIDAYERVVTLVPSFAEAQCNLGALYEAEGHKAQAIQHYAAAKRLLRGKRPQKRLDIRRGSSPPHTPA
jgi:tetratricopeptide (TPR) repeat protein